MEKLKIGVLLSGSGTNLQAIIDEIANGLPVEIVHVLSSRPDAYGIERARAAGIPVTVFDRSCYEDREAADARIAAIMQEAGAEYLVMAGYMRKLTPVVLDDKGPIVAQRTVPVLEDDDIDALEARIHETEHIIYPEVLRAIAEGRMTLDADRKIHIRSVD